MRQRRQGAERLLWSKVRLRARKVWGVRKAAARVCSRIKSEIRPLNLTHLGVTVQVRGLEVTLKRRRRKVQLKIQLVLKHRKIKPQIANISLWEPKERYKSNLQADKIKSSNYSFRKIQALLEQVLTQTNTSSNKTMGLRVERQLPLPMFALILTKLTCQSSRAHQQAKIFSGQTHFRQINLEMACRLLLRLRCFVRKQSWQEPTLMKASHLLSSKGKAWGQSCNPKTLVTPTWTIRATSIKQSHQLVSNSIT